MSRNQKPLQKSRTSVRSRMSRCTGSRVDERNAGRKGEKEEKRGEQRSRAGRRKEGMGENRNVHRSVWICVRAHIHRLSEKSNWIRKRCNRDQEKPRRGGVWEWLPYKLKPPFGLPPPLGCWQFEAVIPAEESVAILISDNAGVGGGVVGAWQREEKEEETQRERG